MSGSQLLTLTNIFPVFRILFDTSISFELFQLKRKSVSPGPSAGRVCGLRSVSLPVDRKNCSHLLLHTRTHLKETELKLSDLLTCKPSVRQKNNHFPPLKLKINVHHSHTTSLQRSPFRVNIKYTSRLLQAASRVDCHAQSST